MTNHGTPSASKVKRRYSDDDNNDDDNDDKPKRKRCNYGALANALISAKAASDAKAAPNHNPSPILSTCF